MTATIWISGRICRIIVTDTEGRVIDRNDEWNNIASGQSWCYNTYPKATQKTVRDRTKIADLDAEWNRCKWGVV